MSGGLRLLLVRHGETEWTERGLLHGRLDAPLSAAGRRHAAQTAACLRGEAQLDPIDVVYTSPLGRAVETATLLAAAVGLTPVALDGVRERAYGWMEGKPMWLADPDGKTVPGLNRLARWIMSRTAEPFDEFAQRTVSAAEALARRHSSGRVVVVTHWGVISMLVASLVDGQPDTWTGRGPWAACGLTELEAVHGCWRITRLNDHAHLNEGSPA
jgi:broad specificity phosphatase PhoE